jgi:hypothetical protein
VVRRGWHSRGFRTANLGLEEVGIAEVTEQLSGMFIQGARAENFGTVAALDTLLVKRPPVGGHERLRQEHGGVAGGTPRRSRG